MNGLKFMLCLALLPALLCATTDTPAAAIAGGWTGEAKIANDFTSTQRLAVNLDIRPDGTVSGRVGQAEVRDGRVEPRHWWQFRAFNHYEFQIDFGLSGALTPDGLTRRSGRLFFSKTGDSLEGWFVSHGGMGFPWQSQKTLKNEMQIQALGLVLHRR